MDPELKARVEGVTHRTGVDEATLVRNCIEALCDHVDRHGQISFPMSINANGVIPVRYPKSSGRTEALHDRPKKPIKP